MKIKSRLTNKDVSDEGEYRFIEEINLGTEPSFYLDFNGGGIQFSFKHREEFREFIKNLQKIEEQLD